MRDGEKVRDHLLVTGLRTSASGLVLVALIDARPE